MTGAPTIRVVIAEDADLIRHAFGLLVDSTDGMEVVGAAGTGRGVVELVDRLAPDVVLMDVRMPDGDGLWACERIVEGHPRTRVVFLTTFDLPDYLYGALRVGASGFLLKNVPPGELLRAIRIAHEGDALLSPELTRRLIDDVARSWTGDVSPLALPARLTDREREVLVEIGSGRSNAEIAARLSLTAATVKTYVSRLLAKLGARDRAQLVVMAYESGLVRPGTSD